MTAGTPRTPILAPPNPFGPYSIERNLPRGGMAEVYYAEDLNHGRRPVALKLIPLRPDINTQEILEAERRGATLQGVLAERDPRVVQIYDSGEYAGFFYIAMEYVEGRDLTELLRGGPIETFRAVGIAAEILEVLGAAHNAQVMLGDTVYQGIIHGDIKPGNIRISPDGRVRVLDFGISKALSLTRDYTSSKFASTRYCSPERLLSGEIDKASDLWAVAVVLYEMLTGRPYFDQQLEGRLQSEICHYRQPKPMPPERIPPALRAVLLRALDPDETRRYIAAQAFHDDLRAVEAGLPTNAGMRDYEDEPTRRTHPAERDYSPDVPTQPVARGEFTIEEAATRRTVGPVGAPTPTPTPAAAVSPQPGPARRPSPLAAMLPPWLRLHGPWIWKLALALAVVLPVVHEFRIYQEGSELSADLAAERIQDINEAWKRYQALAEKSYAPAVLYSPRKVLREKFLGEADKVLADYRDNDFPSVTLADWRRAQQNLQRAVELDPGENGIRGKLRVVDGHIARINGTGRNGNNARLMTEARAKFEEARELWKKAPDPYLGLARVYIYSMRDVERGEEALREAEKRGHPMGRRERAQLADGYRDRADQLAREASQARTGQEARDYLTRADTDYQRAETLYQQIVPFRGAADGLRRCQESRERVAQRRQELLEAERLVQSSPAPPEGK